MRVVHRNNVIECPQNGGYVVTQHKLPHDDLPLFLDPPAAAHDQPVELLHVESAGIFEGEVWIMCVWQVAPHHCEN